MKKIPLRNKNGTVVAHAWIDDEDLPLVSSYRWYRHSCGYATAKKMRNYKSTVYYLHRIITNAPKGKEVDHINGDKLDNRRSNLRVCVHHQNLSNGKFRTNNTSGYKGVTKNKKGGWDTKIWFQGKGIYGGHFQTKEEAAKRYAELAEKYHGEFRRI